LREAQLLNYELKITNYELREARRMHEGRNGREAKNLISTLFFQQNNLSSRA
jgi:hypothetical protein